MLIPSAVAFTPVVNSPLSSVAMPRVFYNYPSVTLLFFPMCGVVYITSVSGLALIPFGGTTVILLVISFLAFGLAFYLVSVYYSS